MTTFLLLLPLFIRRCFVGIDGRRREKPAPFVFASFSALLLALLCWSPSLVFAAPEAHLLRIDPRTAMSDGKPIVTSLVEVGEFKSISDALEECSPIRNYENLLDCWGTSLEKPGALWQAFQFPETAAKLAVRVDAADMFARFVSKEQWSTAQKKEGMGTAWLIALDASNGMGAVRYEDARQAAVEFVRAMGPNDLIRLIIFDDRPQNFTADSKWVSAAKRNEVMTKLNTVTKPVPATSTSKPLFDTIKTIMKTGFKDLGNTSNAMTIPLHQVFVVLSNGAGRQDAATGSISGEELKQYANRGRFPEENTANPKMPLPIVAILFPNPNGSLTNDVYREIDVQFMQSLANPEIGGFFSVVRGGQGKLRGENIVKAVKSRFNAMWLVKWRVACFNPTMEQSFTLGFVGMKSMITPDSSFKNVPIGIDPSTWPLDLNLEQTRAESEKIPVRPGGKVRLYGDFCWGSSKDRAEAYFIPSGTKPDVGAHKGDLDVAKRAMQNLTAQGMRASALEANSSFVELLVPDEEKILDGAGDNLVARLILVDKLSNRSSGIDEKSILTLKAAKKAFPTALALGIIGAILFFILLLILAFGGAKKDRGGRPPTDRGRLQSAHLPRPGYPPTNKS